MPYTFVRDGQVEPRERRRGGGPSYRAPLSMKAQGASFQAAELEEMLRRAQSTDRGYVPAVLRSESLSVGLYTLAAAAVDRQSPHLEDEVYYTVRGRATLVVGGRDHSVREGTVLFVPAGEEHRFHDITEELVLLVFWAPPEGTGPRRSESDARSGKGD
jgi:mannose-6-phosphate isomerase-like protein (cupin superfamily)